MKKNIEFCNFPLWIFTIFILRLHIKLSIVSFVFACLLNVFFFVFFFQISNRNLCIFIIWHSFYRIVHISHTNRKSVLLLRCKQRKLGTWEIKCICKIVSSILKLSYSRSQPHRMNLNIILVRPRSRRILRIAICQASNKTNQQYCESFLRFFASFFDDAAQRTNIHTQIFLGNPLFMWILFFFFHCVFTSPIRESEKKNAFSKRIKVKLV